MHTTVKHRRQQQQKLQNNNNNKTTHPLIRLSLSRLLKEVSADNRAFARQIDESTDTEEQLVGFYQEIATPLMADVEVSYLVENVDPESLVRQGTTHYYSGGEVRLGYFP